MGCGLSRYKSTMLILLFIAFVSGCSKERKPDAYSSSHLTYATKYATKGPNNEITKWDYTDFKDNGKGLDRLP
jgi:PBP1b-binding outer membrane lipoprotein LpoB